MSTNPKDLNPKQLSETVIAKSKRSVDRNVRNLMQEMEHENTLLQESPNSRVQRVLKMFRGLKPLFVVIGALPLLPPNWRGAFAMFIQALDALAQVGTDFTTTTSFKAGKDI